ncbi:hypothetical protein [Cochleicola gelatinilyticus]|uniref:Lipoprotein n=1 Tax=Cochleicola gelatinilyticus TaxID=1763537 RepID=A0A167F222_9FLAO|nr:hypothetical protein [Cochleicola gelatinilyticus]OAB76108.1 hypothetical protein ULVI_13705 [Cochleicola gelatinilyticus]
MKKIYYLFLFLSISFSCKNRINDNSKNLKHEEVNDTLEAEEQIPLEKVEISISTFDLKKTLSLLGEAHHTGNRYSDWMTNKIGFIDKLLKIEDNQISISSTSYTYKNDYVFYLHTLKHSNDSISIKPFLENIQGKHTEGYTQLRVLIFAMKNEKEANFIDIPLTSGYSKKYNELIKNVYNKIDFVVVSCDSTKACSIKDFRP